MAPIAARHFDLSPMCTREVLLIFISDMPGALSILFLIQPEVFLYSTNVFICVLTRVITK